MNSNQTIEMKVYKLFILCVAALVLPGCDIDRPLEDAISDQSFWKKEDDLKMAANYLYTFLPGLPNFDDNWSDDGFASLPSDISSGTRIPPATDASYTQAYQVIRAANNILEKAPIAREHSVPDATVNLYLGEALFFRAWAYFDLFKKYGGVPLVLSIVGEKDPILTSKQASREEVIASIYKDLDEAASKLTTPTQRVGDQYGRATNTAALSLKSRVALFEGTRLKFHGGGDANTHLNLALDAARKVIQSNEHALNENYYNVFQPAGEGRSATNKENVFVKKYGVSVANNVTGFNAGSIVNNGNNITKSLVDAYLMEDGLPTDKSPLYEEPKEHTEYFANRDPRMALTIFKKGDPYTISGNYTFPALNFQNTGFTSRKFVNPSEIGNASTGNMSFIDRPLIRYAEVLLNFAEAQLELSGGLTDEQLDMSVNLLRRRAGIPDLTNAFVTEHGLNMREEIRRERRVELAVEGFRYWDIIRWKIAEEVLPRPILGSYFFKDGFGLAQPTLTEDDHILVQSAETRRFNVQKDYLWPFPVNELAKNPNLAQNPNW
jgi:hypothetical protein